MKLTKQELVQNAQKYLDQGENWGKMPKKTDGIYFLRDRVVLPITDDKKRFWQIFEGAMRLVDAKLDLGQICHGKGKSLIGAEWHIFYTAERQDEMALGCQRLYRQRK